jgi:hypothetical protein
MKIKMNQNEGKALDFRLYSRSKLSFSVTGLCLVHFRPSFFHSCFEHHLEEQ